MKPKHSEVWPLVAAQIEAHTGVRMARLLRAGVRPANTLPNSFEDLLTNPQLKAERNKIFVPESYFFRHLEHWNWLFATALVAAKKKRPLRVLCLGASTGEEVWSAAAVLEEANCPIVAQQVVGWELVQERVDKARGGQYELWSHRTEAPRFGRWISVDGPRVTVNPKLYERVTFRQQNIMELPPVHDKFDIVFCRNVAIYWSNEAKQSMVRWLGSVLAPNGTAVFSATDNFSGVEGVYYDHVMRSSVFRQTATLTREPRSKDFAASVRTYVDQANQKYEDPHSIANSRKQYETVESTGVNPTLVSTEAQRAYEAAIMHAAAGEAEEAKKAIRKAIFHDGSNPNFWRMYRFLTLNDTVPDHEIHS